MSAAALFFADDDRQRWTRARATDRFNEITERHGLTSLPEYYMNPARPVRQHQTAQYPIRHDAEFLQDNVPSQPRSKHDAERETMPSLPNGRNSDPLTKGREQTRDALSERFKVHVTEPSKIAARRVGRSAETVDGYRQVGVPMAWADMIEWCRAHPGFALDVVEMMGLDIDRDREAYAMFLSLQKAVRER